MAVEQISNQNNRHFYISCLNVLSSVAVVALHANGGFWSYRDDHSWAISNFIECAFYFAVPVFFMLTGATLFDYPDKYDTKTFIKKRMEKAVIPFLFWGAFAFFQKSLKDPQGFFINERRFDAIFNGIVGAGYVPVYWFFVPLFCIYLSIPLFANIDKAKKCKTLNYLACVGFVCNILIPFVISRVNNYFGWNISWGFDISALGGHLLYPVVGYLLHCYPLNKQQRAGIYIAALAGFAMHLFGTYSLSQEQGAVSEYYKGYLNLPCVLYSVGVFVFVKYSAQKIRSEAVQRFVVCAQKYTFEIYLLHMFLYDKISNWLYRLHVVDTSPMFVVLMTAINIPACVIITFILRKVLKLKVIVP